MSQPKYKIKRYNADHTHEDIERIINHESQIGWDIVSLSEAGQSTTIVYFNMNMTWAKIKKHE